MISIFSQERHLFSVSSYPSRLEFFYWIKEILIFRNHLEDNILILTRVLSYCWILKQKIYKKHMSRIANLHSSFLCKFNQCVILSSFYSYYLCLKRRCPKLPISSWEEFITLSTFLPFHCYFPSGEGVVLQMTYLKSLPQ